MSRHRIIGILLLFVCGLLFALTNQEVVSIRAVSALLGVIGVALLLSTGTRGSRPSSSGEGGGEGSPLLYADSEHGHNGGGDGGDSGGDSGGGH